MFSPGKLTIACQQKKRERYIPPVSLYIFVSIVFFLLLPVFQQSFIRVQDRQRTEQQSPETARGEPAAERVQKAKEIKRENARTAESYPAKVGEDIFAALRENPKEFKEKVLHSFPRIFFFMIPVLAALLKLFLIKKEAYYFVDHAVFALHMHSFVFIACLIPLISPFTANPARPQ